MSESKINGVEVASAEEELDVVELEGESGDKEEFVILEEVDFEDAHYGLLTPLAEFETFNSKPIEALNPDSDCNVLSLIIFKITGDMFDLVEDEELGNRIMVHLERLNDEQGA